MNKELIYEIAKYTNDITILKIIFKLPLKEQDDLLRIVKYIKFIDKIYHFEESFINEVIRLFCQNEHRDAIMTLLLETPILEDADIMEIRAYIYYLKAFNHPLLLNSYLIAHYHGERHWQLIRYLVEREIEGEELHISDILLQHRSPAEIISLCELMGKYPYSNELRDKTIFLSYESQFTIIQFYLNASPEMQALIDYLLNDSLCLSIPDTMFLDIIRACDKYFINKEMDFKWLEGFIKKAPAEVGKRMQIWAICDYREEVYQLLTDRRFDKLSLKDIGYLIMYYQGHLYDMRIFNIIKQYSCVGAEAIMRELEHLTYNDSAQNYLDKAIDIKTLLPLLDKEKKLILK